MAKLTLSGEEHIIPELNFAALERAWPFIEIALVSGGGDPLRQQLAALQVVAAGIMEDENFQPDKYKVTVAADNPDKIHEQIVNHLRKKLKAREIAALRTCLFEIIEEAGLTMANEGEQSGTEEETEAEASLDPHSTETAPATSPSLSPPDAKAEAGSASESDGLSEDITQ